MKAAVLGKPITHSKSPVLHNAGYKALGLLDWSYGSFECDATQLPELVTGLSEEYVGFSVTMPAKFAALEFATEATTRAQLIGSANTLVRIDSGWRADNTDCDGVAGALQVLWETQAEPLFPMGSQAVIIGAGGTARSVLWTLARLGISSVVIINRSDRSNEYHDLASALGICVQFKNFSDDIAALVQKSAVVVSTTPSAVIATHLDAIARVPVLDVIYDPWPTSLVKLANKRGIPSVGGHVMLAHQAYGQFTQFTSKPAPKAAMWFALCQALGIVEC